MMATACAITSEPSPGARPADEAPQLLNTDLCVDIETRDDDLSSVLQRAAKQARLLSLAIEGVIVESEDHVIRPDDLRLLWEVAFGVDMHASAAEKLYAEQAGWPDEWRRRLGRLPDGGE